MANNVQNVSFSPYATDQAAIERKRALSAALQQQSMQPIENAPAPGGWATPISPWQGLAKIASGALAGHQQTQADKQQKDLGEKVQSDYRAMVAKGLKQLQGAPGVAAPDAELGGGPGMPSQAPDPAGALATFSEHPMGSALAPLAMQGIQRQQLVEALKGMGGAQGAPQPPQGNPMAPGGGSVMSPGGGAPQAPQQPQQGPGSAASGVPMEAWLATDPSGKSYLQHLADQGKSSGRVNYDQQGRAYTVMANGQAQFLPGINARDKGEVVNLGGSSELRNPFTGAQMGQPMTHSLTPMQGIEAPLQLGRYQFETGQTPPGMAGGGGAPAAPGTHPRPAAATPPSGQPALTPKDQAKLNAERASNLPQAKQATELQAQDLDRLTSLANELREHPGLVGATGMQGKFPSIPGGPAAQAEALNNSLKAQISGMKLQAMRNSSKTGGAVGNVTEKEWPRLENMVVALDPVKMGEETYKLKLDEVMTEIGKVKKSLTDAFESEYGQKIGGGNLSPAEMIELQRLKKKYVR